MQLKRSVFSSWVPVATLIILAITVLGPQFSALAVTSPYELTGTVDGSDPVFDTDKVMLDCTSTWTGTNWHYETRTVTVDRDTGMTIRDLDNTNDGDSFYGIYDVTTTPFNPSNLPLTSQCVGAATNIVNVVLNTGRNYLFVVSDFNNAAGGNYRLQLTTTDGATNMVIGAPGGAPPVPAKISSITSAAANGNYGPGATITINVNFDKSVTFETIGTGLQLKLNNGATLDCVGCINFPNPYVTTYSFTYNVGFGQNTADLDALDSASLVLNGGVIRDAGGTIADPTTPVGVAAASLASQKNIAIVTPTLSINDVAVTEGNAGTVNAVFTVTLSVPLQAPTVTVNYATANQTAVAPGDYTATSGTLTFNPGTTTQTVTVVVNGDTAYEANETFLVNLSTATNASFADNQGVGTITNDDAAPTLSINNVTLNEGNAGTTTFGFTVSLSAASGLTTTVNYASADGTATAGTDYTAVTGTLTFNPGVTMQTINVLVTGETVFEVNETFTVTLNTPTNATILTGTGTGTITNDDTQPTISINDIAQNEGNTGTTAFISTVSLSSPSSQTITMDYTTAIGTATVADNDYVTATGTLTFNPGVTTQIITVNVNGDTVYEATEVYFVNLSNAVNATFFDLQGVGTITNDDAAPTLSINNVTLNEGNAGTTTFTFDVTLSAVSSMTTTVNYASADGTASAGSDYTAVSGTLTFNPGVTAQTVNVLVNGDTIYETNEAFTVVLSGATNANILTATGTGTITNDDAAPTLSIGNVTLNEGNAGTTAFTFTVSLSAASGATTTVNYASADGTAAAGSDYTAVTGTLTFNPGVTAQTVTVNVNGDPVFEANETFTVNLSAPVNATILTGTGTGTITNDDTAPSLSINSTALNEGNAGTTSFTFTVTLTGASGLATTVDFASADGTATTADNDYTATSGTLTFNPSAAAVQTLTISVPVNGDTVYEPTETFTVTLSNAANATIGTAVGTGTITNDDTQPTIAIDDIALNEGNTGTTAFIFTVSLSGASSQTITVDYLTADGTAAAGDYTSVGGTLTFAPGTTSLTATVLVTGDIFNELNEGFLVNLSNPTNATIADGQGVGTINNDDAVPSLSINSMTLNEGDAATTAFTFTVSLSVASGQLVTVNYASADGTATTADNDYTSASGTLTFAPGETTKTITVLGTGDTVFEATETFTVALSAPVNATILTGTGTGTITNDDGQPTFSISDVSQAEGDSGTSAFIFTITRSGNSNNTDTVDYTTTDGTALTADNDYVATNGTLTFTSGMTSQTLLITVNGDVISETDETFTVDLSNASAPAIIGDAQALGTIVNDEPPPGVSVADVSILENAGAGQFTITLNPANSVAVTVDYAIADGTAVLNTHYSAAATNGTLTFNPGDTTLNVPFAAIDNTTYNGNRTFTLTLSNVAGSAITRAVGTALIVDNEARPVVVVNLPDPPPATPCKDVNFEEPGTVRTHFTNDADKDALHCRVIASNGSYMTWLGGPLTSDANIGNKSIIDLGVLGATDVFALDGRTGFAGDVDVCLKGSGYMIYFNANNAPRFPQLWSAWTTDAFPGYTCTTLYAPGMVVLVANKP